MIMIYILLFLIGTLLISLSPFLLKRLTKKLNISKSVRYIVAFSSIILFFLVASSIFMGEYNICWRGYKTIIFLLIGLNIMMIWSYINTKFQNRYYQMFIEGALFLVIFISSFISAYNLMDYKKNNVYSDKNYRLESYSGFMITADILPYLYVKDGVIEKRYHLYYENKSFGFHQSEMESCDIIKQENSYSVIFIMKDGSEIKTSTIYHEPIILFNN